MSCPSAVQLVKVAFDDVDTTDAVHGHVPGCSSCADEVKGLRWVAALVAVSPGEQAASQACLDEITVAALANDTGPLTTDAKRHLAECARCREQLAGAIEILGAAEIGEEIDRLEHRDWTGKRRMPAWTRVAALAAVLAGLMVAPSVFGTRADETAQHTRGLRDADPTITKTIAPGIIAPIGSVSAVAALTWTSVPGATRYDIRLFNREGTVVWESESNDTTIVLPRSVELRPGSVYLYQVDARTGIDRSAQSELVEFRIDTRVR